MDLKRWAKSSDDKGSLSVDDLAAQVYRGIMIAAKRLEPGRAAFNMLRDRRVSQTHSQSLSGYSLPSRTEVRKGDLRAHSSLT
ncbi:hypothetical protein O181_063302 [Austropuccinia psidii MF-1]|uniref:Uncharacterized protein n=1 Tax=Austropuccinia psidii MF-1 TaxID=1389203 RepID=A0A9Q3I186_9BASI|nr:hypothetical protein [Austropuccinia psidii MF-1]